MHDHAGQSFQRADALSGGVAGRTIFHLTWIGSSDGMCAQLLDRIGRTCDAHGRRLRIHFEPLDSSVLASALHSSDSAVVAWADRVIVACETRLDYPWHIIQLLERLDAEVPWGVVTGTWHDGSRRTGLGPVTHWQLPWYRWWEGWYGWCFPEWARPASRCMTQFEPVIAPIDLATPPSIDPAGSHVPTPSELDGELMTGPHFQQAAGPRRSLMIVAACRETLQGWQLSAASAGWSCVAEHPQQASQSTMVASGAKVPDCILWDDSCQDCWPGGDARLEQACRQLSVLQRRYPDVPIVAGLSLVHVSAWPDLQRAGASDFVVKPSFGLPLADYLTARQF